MVTDKENTYLLDTCVCIALIKGNQSVVDNIRSVGYNNCKISEITVAELIFGAFKSGRKKHFDDVSEIRSLFKQLTITDCLEEYGDIRWKLEKSGNKIDHFDLLIGATALHENMTLVTGNVAHFERIPGLRIENWIK